MIIKPELVKRIKDHFNLNIYETKVWLALLTKGVVSAGETAEMSGVPRSRTYDVLESLAKQGFAMVKVGKPVKYIAMDPKTVIEKMKNQVMQDAQDRVKNLSNLKATQEYVELEQLHKTGISPVKVEDLSGHVRGRSNVMSKIREMCDNAEKDVAICTSVGDFESKARVLLPALERLEKRKIKVNIALSGDADAIKRFSNKHNYKVKHTENTGRFFIADKNEMLFMINNENADEEVGLWLKSPYFASTMQSMFESHTRKQ